MKMIVEGEQMYILIRKERIIYIIEMILNRGIATYPNEDDSRRRANVHIN